MNHHIHAKLSAAISSFLIVCCLALTAYFFINPPAFPLQLHTEGLRFLIWPSETLAAFCWPVLALLVILSGVSFGMVLFAVRRGSLPGQIPWDGILKIFAPLTLLPLAWTPMFLADMVPPLISTNLRLFVLLAVLSVFFARIMTELFRQESINSGRTAKWAWTIFLVAVIIFAYGGYRFSKKVGEHAGDEGHYLVQAQSLYEDRDLDIKNQLLEALGVYDPAKINRGNFHIHRHSSGEAFYSVHPFGLSLLLAPSWKWGLGGRHIVLGLVSGAGLAGLFLLCRRMGAGNVAAFFAVASLGASISWHIYSYRALPEVLAATLTIWTFWAIAAQRDRPWTSLLIAAACCVYLPFAHTRFIPVSLMGIGLYGLFGLLGAERFRAKVTRLGLFTLICMAGYGGYLLVQSLLFTGPGLYSVRETLFSYPWGAWEIFVSDRGIASVFPVIFWLAGAMVAWLLVDKDNRLFCLGIIATFFSCLLTSATFYWYTGGSSLPGRYLIVVLPLLFVGAAVMLERVSDMARVWFFFLSLFSTVLIVLVWTHLPAMGRSFILPMHFLTSMPMYQDIFFPHASFRDEFDADNRLANIYGLTALAMTMVLFLLNKRNRVASIAAMVVVLGVGLTAQAGFESNRFKLQRYIEALSVDANAVIQTRRLHEGPAFELRINPHSMRAITGINTLENGVRGRSAHPERDPPGELAWGNHVALIPGEYLITYQFEISNCNEEDRVASLDVAANRGERILARKKLTCSPGATTAVLALDLDSFIIVEPRVIYHGRGSFVLYEVLIQEVVAGSTP
ncbi:hypothetical protein [Desulfonatronum thioautotrophicum]|uniref:hypothetical protein n=1 Tax=Desulfonatronum thioautotrophicum TaxID=617001 RepID=UPI0005EBA8EC|nr:hypothetical protein [Desulfonatronum thioautotrophicum]